MKKKLILQVIIFCLPGLMIESKTLKAQQVNCVLKAPVFTFDFGTVQNKKTIDATAISQYKEISGDCPDDGHFSYVPKTADCFHPNWITVREDHTPGDTEGNMMLVNATLDPGLFFVAPVNGLIPNTHYQLSAWMVNVCRLGWNCDPRPPQFSFIIETAVGNPLANFASGELLCSGAPVWTQYSAFFKTPPGVGTVVLKIVNKVKGGCGNDFALDDIQIRGCAIVKPVITTARPPGPSIKKTAVPTATPVTKKEAVSKPIEKRQPVINPDLQKDSLPLNRPPINIKPVADLPRAIATRANPIIKRITTPATEILIDLYDNGEIDGDTVSIYHNNQLLIARAGISAKAVSFRLKVDGMHPHHELVMVANNLGSIPPNTSLMIITAKDQRYEVFISSSEQKNAKVVIDLKE